MRILVIAYACEPGRGSEPGVGWNIPAVLAETHDVWVVTRRNNRRPIERFVGSGDRRPQFVYHDVSWALPIKKWIGIGPYHYLWQLTARSRVRSLSRRVGFDVGLHLTLGSLRYPSPLSAVGFPYVLGPAGGAEQASPAFWRKLGVGGALLECLRWLSNRLMAADPLVRQTWRRAALILASSDDSAYFLEGHRANSNIAVEPSIAVDDAMLAEPMGAAEAEGTGPQTDVGSLRILCVGRLVGWKGIHLAVEAAAAAHDRGVPLSLTILGRGPQAGRLLELAYGLGLGQRLTIIPALPTLDDVAALYREHDLLIFPSLHDSGGMAVVEAMAAGIPVVCLGIGGPALSVTSESGFVIEARSPERSVSAIVDAICLLASDGDMRRQMGAAGRQRVVDNYTWASRARAVERHLRGVTESSRPQ